MSLHDFLTHREEQHQPDFSPRPPSFEDSLIRFGRRIQDAANGQDKLSKSRAELLVKRERIRASSKQVHAKRVEAGDAEVALMDELRSFVNLHEDLPASLIESFNLVESTRNDLGVLEEDFLHAERTLSGSEWTFMEEENDLYQFDLPELFDALKQDLQVMAQQRPQPPPPPPPPPLPHRVALSHMYSNTTNQPPLCYSSGSPVSLPPSSQLPPPPPLLGFSTIRTNAPMPLPNSVRPRMSVNYLNGLGQQFNLSSNQGTSFANSAYDVLLLESEANTRSDLVTDISSISMTERIRQIEDPGIQRQNNKTSYDDERGSGSKFHQARLSSPTEDNDLGSLGDGFVKVAPSGDTFNVSSTTAIKQRVLDWLFDNFKGSYMEKALYRNTLDAHGVGTVRGRSLEDLAKPYWSIDSWSELQKGETVIPRMIHGQDDIMDSGSWTRGDTYDLSRDRSHIATGKPDSSTDDDVRKTYFEIPPSVVTLPSPMVAPSMPVSQDARLTSYDTQSSYPKELNTTLPGVNPALPATISTIESETTMSDILLDYNLDTPRLQDIKFSEKVTTAPSGKHTLTEVKISVPDYMSKFPDYETVQSLPQTESRILENLSSGKALLGQFDSPRVASPDLLDINSNGLPFLGFHGSKESHDIALPPSLCSSTVDIDGSGFPPRSNGLCVDDNDTKDTTGSYKEKVPPISIQRPLDEDSIFEKKALPKLTSQSPDNLSRNLCYQVRAGVYSPRSELPQSQAHGYYHRLGDLFRVAFKGRSRSMSCVREKNDDTYPFTRTMSSDRAR
ncbi:hypothetical protein OPT61_g784 [Boeremia exigua]|uniref:Uncharacterized protein n=1 Tax=Boeremia exigua TaxID=749465 RepID=A0ACC2ISJ3_9PLEO|nr:hypothetical protein OPT61_g784 [Boeremia exigua]